MTMEHLHPITNVSFEAASPGLKPTGLMG